MMLHVYRKNAIRIFVFILLLGIGLGPAATMVRASNWSLYKRVSVNNSTGDCIFLENINRKGLFIRFFAHNRKENIAFRAPRYRIDQGAVHDLAGAKYLRYGKTRWFRYRLMKGWDPNNPLLQELQQGKELIIQYYPGPNLIKEAVFKLQGIHEAVREIWPISPSKHSPE